IGQDPWGGGSGGSRDCAGALGGRRRAAAPRGVLPRHDNEAQLRAENRPWVCDGTTPGSPFRPVHR
ncbi:hypothetical protein, partial [Bradyrhizobium sp.]|uniref:hypothetical protein n=1 Tax=Bradyrhizobium sp. TaxID=376 RepID=UPI00391A4514